jgi:hypothetical protein
MGKMAGPEFFDQLEPEPKFLTTWSRSCTKMDRLRNTDCDNAGLTNNLLWPRSYDQREKNTGTQKLRYWKIGFKRCFFSPHAKLFLGGC